MSDQPFSDEIMCEMCINQYIYAKTCVFWDVEDYPIPSGCDPVSMEQKIRSALAGVDYNGEVSIKAYVDKALSDELRGKYCNAGITVSLIPEGNEYSRISPMLVDAYVWALENPSPASMIVFSKKMPIMVMMHFQNLFRLGFGVFLSDPNMEWQWRARDRYWSPPLESSALFLTRLFDKKRKRDDTKEEAIANAAV